MIRKSGWIVMFLTLLLTGCSGKQVTPAPIEAESDPLQQAMELNRAGQWDKANQVAREWLDRKGQTAAVLERCEALFQVTYSNTRLGKMEVVRESLLAFDQDCGDIPTKHWLPREMAKLRPEVGGGPTSPSAENHDGFWKVVDAASLAMDTVALEEHKELCEATRADACLVVRKGRIVQEWYGDGYQTPAPAMSSTKSITSLLVGMLVDEGKIKSIDEPVCSFIPEWCVGIKGKVTIRHLLTMTSGLPSMQMGGVGTVAAKNRFVISLAPTKEPGTVWAYSNEGAQLLSPILDRAAGEPIQDYARRRLFAPLGMKDTRLRLDQAGNAWTYADMETTPRDLARIGLLMLQKGMWNNERIVSEAWIDGATRLSQDLNERYGILWWLYSQPQGFAALGYLETNLYVFPKLDLVVVRMQKTPFTTSREESYEPRALPLFQRMVRPTEG